MSGSARTEIVEVELPDGSVILAEVEAGASDVSGIGDRLRLDEARETVVRVGRWAMETIRDGLPKSPDEFEVQFGVKLGLETGKAVGILAKASGEASLAVRMVWKRETLEAERKVNLEG